MVLSIRKKKSKKIHQIKISKKFGHMSKDKASKRSLDFEMKNSRNLRQAYGTSLDRKNAKRGEKSGKYSKLDRKSSRGMIYENEELRLRTININAEVERGQSDIKRLRRENEHLRREIWTLRDECDRLNKRFKARIAEQSLGDHGCNSARCSGGSGCAAAGARGSNGGAAGCDSHSNSEDSDSCDTCKCMYNGGDGDGDDDDGACSDECCNGACLPPKHDETMFGEADGHDDHDVNGGASPQQQQQQQKQQEGGGGEGSAAAAANNANSFDHLSVVSEETLSNVEMHGSQQANAAGLLGYAAGARPPALNGGSSTASLCTPLAPLTPLTPVELVATQLSDLQASIPPLSYFESVLQQHMRPSMGTTPESAATTATGSTVRHTNGWDYNLQSPFVQRKFGPATSPANGRPAAPQQQPQQQGAAGTMTTFGPSQTTTSQPLPLSTLASSHRPPPVTGASNTHTIETVAITTMPTTGAPINAAHHGGSPKHFFSPLKPRLKLNTALANKNLVAVSVPDVPPPGASNGASQPPASLLHYDPPDIFVTNGLASPYHRSTSALSGPVPPPLPQRTASQTSSQTDSVHLKSILNEIETISEDILAIQLEKAKSREDLHKDGATRTLQTEDKSKKPYRSEMNLLLTYDGNNPTIKPAVSKPSRPPPPALAGPAAKPSNGNGKPRRASSLERDESESPPTGVPDPMLPFPANRTYIGFEQFDNALPTAPPPPPLANRSPTQRPPLPPPPGTTNISAAAITLKAPPPVPPSRQHLSTPAGGSTTQLNVQLRGAAPPRSPSQGAMAEETTTSGLNHGTLSPNKSHLYSAIANAAAKRAQFRATSVSQLSLAGAEGGNPTITTTAPSAGVDGENGAPEGAPFEGRALDSVSSELSLLEAARKKARRVSIACSDTNAPSAASSAQGHNNDRADSSQRSQGPGPRGATPPATAGGSTANGNGNGHFMAAPPPAHTPTTLSCTDLSNVGVAGKPQHPALKNLSLKPPSHSTPNSPHSSRRRRSNSNVMNNAAATAEGQQQQQQQQQCAVHHQHSSSLDVMRVEGSATAAAAGTGTRSKCSRRHSEGTIAGGGGGAGNGAHAQPPHGLPLPPTQHLRVSCASSGGNGGHHHHHHHHSHQHHAHPHTSMISNASSHPLHHSHHSHPDSASLSDQDRLSNSLASSRESSTTFSMRSQRRKISISSHTAGKIPWCGCWGNGCL